ATAAPIALVSRHCCRPSEVATGFEPVYTALQAAASPLGHATAKAVPCRLRAADGTRTRDPHLGQVMLYQLSTIRTSSARYPSQRATTLYDGRGTRKILRGGTWP